MALRDEDLPAVYRELDRPGVVDVHVHFMPDRVLHKVWAYFDQVEHYAGVPWPIAYRFDETERLSILRRLGVLTYPALCYPHKPGMAQWLSEWARDFAAVGDLESAVDAIRDAHATFTEARSSRPDAGTRSPG